MAECSGISGVPVLICLAVGEHGRSLAVVLDRDQVLRIRSASLAAGSAVVMCGECIGIDPVWMPILRFVERYGGAVVRSFSSLLVIPDEEKRVLRVEVVGRRVSLVDLADGVRYHLLEHTLTHLFREVDD